MFEQNAVENLFRGGGLLDLVTDKGRICIFDERSKKIREPAGIARFGEGKNLVDTAIREGILEEISIFYYVGKVRTKLIPKGYSNIISKQINGWNITVDNIEEAGEIKLLEYFCNNDNEALEALIQWDLSQNDKDIIICHTEDWFNGGSSGFTPWVINDLGNIVGCYDGQHGYMSLSIAPKLHTTLAHILSLPPI
jgi:hypothetical protein